MSAAGDTFVPVGSPIEMPGPCALCGGVSGCRIRGAWMCAVCGWRYGDVPDADLPLPRVHVVYYLRFDRRVKIGTTANPRQRLARIRHDEVLAFERGDRVVEQERHREFSASREGGEWFTLSSELSTHIVGLRSLGDPWHLYAAWFSHALRA